MGKSIENMLIVSVFGDLINNSNDRIVSLMDNLSIKKKILTTDFSHREKKYINKSSIPCVDTIHVLSYEINLSLRRIVSHWFFAFKLLRYLIKNGKNYSVIYCIIPTPSSAFICCIYKWFKPRKKLIIDIIDIWPESLVPLNNKYKWISPLLLPWRWLSIIAYKNANAIFAATKKYHDIGKKYNSKVFSSHYPLGIDLAKIIEISGESTIVLNKPINELWICYAGNLGASYDFEAMIASIQFAHSKTYRIKFLLIGGGERENELKNKLVKLGIDFLITGIVPYHDYLKYLSRCDIGFNIFISCSQVAQSYKFNDYIASSVFVINNLKGETAELIENFNVGTNHFGGNQRLGETLKRVIDEWPYIQTKINANCSILISKELSKKKIYERMDIDIHSLL